MTISIKPLTDPFTALGPDVNRKIISFLPCQDVVVSASVSKAFNRVMNDALVWNRIADRPPFLASKNIKNKLKFVKFYNNLCLAHISGPKAPPFAQGEDLLSVRWKMDGYIHEENSLLMWFFGKFDSQTETSTTLSAIDDFLKDNIDPSFNSHILKKSLRILKDIFERTLSPISPLKDRTLAHDTLHLFLQILSPDFKIPDNLKHEFIKYVNYSIGEISAEYDKSRNTPFTILSYQIFKILIEYIKILYSVEEQKIILHSLLVKLCLADIRIGKDFVDKDLFVSEILNTRIIEVTDQEIYCAIFTNNEKLLRLFFKYQKFEKEKISLFLRVCDFATVHFLILQRNFPTPKFRSIISEEAGKSADVIKTKDISLSHYFGTTSLEIYNKLKIDLTLVEQWVWRFDSMWDLDNTYKFFTGFSSLLSREDRDRVFNIFLEKLYSKNISRLAITYVFLEDGFNLSYSNLKVILKSYLKKQSLENLNIVKCVAGKISNDLKLLALQDLDSWQKSDKEESRSLYETLKDILIHNRRIEEECCVIL